MTGMTLHLVRITSSPSEQYQHYSAHYYLLCLQLTMCFPISEITEIRHNGEGNECQLSIYVSVSPRPTSGLGIFQKNSKDSACSHICAYNQLQQKDTKQKQTDKAHGCISEESKQASKSSFSEVTQDLLISSNNEQ